MYVKQAKCECCGEIFNDSNDIGVCVGCCQDLGKNLNEARTRAVELAETLVLMLPVFKNGLIML